MPPSCQDGDRAAGHHTVKRALAAATVAAAAKVLGTAAAKGLPRDTVAAQVGQWLSYLPHGGQWPAALPRPVGR
jgi:hypothetical protein